MKYKWDEKKRISNLAKHGVDFPDAAVALQDPANLTIEDPDATGEQRWITMGMDWMLRILIVVWAEPSTDCIRIISVRKASPAESRRYNGV